MLSVAFRIAIADEALTLLYARVDRRRGAYCAEEGEADERCGENKDQRAERSPSDLCFHVRQKAHAASTCFPHQRGESPLRALSNLVTDQKRGRKNKSTENGVAKDFFPNCCRNVTIHDNTLNTELR
jgi:hypothetical protein